MGGKRKRYTSVLPPQDAPVALSLNHIYKENYPLFCFKYLSTASICNCTSHKIFYDFLIRLQKLSELGWPGIRTSDRHSFGMEQIPISRIKPKLPVCITPEVKSLHVLRANGNNLPFVGVQIDRVFRVFFIEARFGDIYDHE